VAQGLVLLGAALVFAARQRKAREAVADFEAKPAEEIR